MNILIGLIRHGRTQWNLEGRIQGRTDIPITDNEAERLKGFDLPERWQGARLVSSPLARAQRTAAILGGREPELDDRLIEMNFGEWEGAHGKDLLLDPASGFRHVTEWGMDFQIPGGESIAELSARTHAAVVDLAKGGRNTLVVSHMGVMRGLLARAHHWPYLDEPPFQIKRDRIYALRVDPEGSIEIEDEQPERLVPR